ENPGILGGPQRQKAAGGRRIGNPQGPFRSARWAETDKHPPDGHARNLRYVTFRGHDDFSVIYLLSFNASLMNRVSIYFLSSSEPVTQIKTDAGFMSITLIIAPRRSLRAVCRGFRAAAHRCTKSKRHPPTPT